MQRTTGIEYSAPPIVEAVIQFVFETKLTVSQLKKLKSKIKKNYVHSDDELFIEANVDLIGRETKFDETPQVRFSSEDRTEIAIVQLNSLIISQLAPYPGWESLYKRASTLLGICHESLGFRKFKRIGMRYINRIDIPSDENLIKFEDYLDVKISLPAKWEMIQNYVWRFERLFPEYGVRGAIQSSLVNPVVPETGAVLLDIDLTTQENLPLKLPEILEKVGEMRALKNEIFETCVSDLAKRMFQT